MTRHTVGLGTNPATTCSRAVSPFCKPTKYQLDGQTTCTYCICLLIERGDLHLVDPAPDDSPDSIEVAWE